KVLMGTERRSMLIAEKEKLVIAYHEAGNALMGKLLPDANPVHKVTIIPRGMALGVTFHLPQQDKHINTKAYYLSELCVIYGGRVAEEIKFGEISTGASNDIEKATQIGRMMVCNWGMSEKIGPIAFGRKEEHIFLGREISQHRDFSEETSRAIDGEIRQILESQLTKTRQMLADNKDKLDMLALAVLEHEYLDADEIDKILNGEKLSVVKKPRVMVSRRKKDEPKKDESTADKKDEENKGQVLDKTA
ncbi:MAG: cell division protein FtsH, partial [Fibrobacteres bacterium]|nr:cell division protein FtsH [Fibrobacterota bacterium]